MRRVIQKTITTTKIISLTITHSEEEVEYTLTTEAEQLAAPKPAANDQPGPDQAALQIGDIDEAGASPASEENQP